MTAPPTSSLQSTERFSDRVVDYSRFRPSYPIEILDLLAERCSLTPESVIADIGAGTGLSARMFLDNGNPVVGVEPNKEMREAGDHFLSDFARYQSIDGTAEATRLPTAGIDLIVSGQAFHWFDRDKTRTEWKRTLKGDGWCVLMWNDRQTDTTAFLGAYEKLLRTYSDEYPQVDHRNVQNSAVFAKFFGADCFEASFTNQQWFDFDGLLGRLHSSSYVPAKTHPSYPDLAMRAREIFDAHATQGRVEFRYDTRVYFGQIA